MSKSCATRGLGLWLAISALGLTGCYAHGRADAVWVEAEHTPVHVDVYPHTVYEGRVVYLIEDRWYTRDSGRWVYYRVEPAPLHRHRLVVQKAPRAPERRAAPRAVERRHRDHDHDRGRDDHHPHRDDDHRDADRVRERHDVRRAPPARVRD